MTHSASPIEGVTTPPRPANIDGCPSCIANTEPPRLTHEIEGGVVAFYRCTDCRHEWSTAWGER